MDYTVLHTEFTTDPMGLGYAPYVVSANDQALANLLNAPGAGTVTVTSLDNASFVTAFLPYLANVAALSNTAKQAMYWQIWTAIVNLPTISFGNSNVSGMLSQAVTDGILTSAQATELQERSGSRAEVLFGAGTVITPYDCGMGR